MFGCAYDAMVSDRPYRCGMPSEQAVHELRRCAGTQFDPVVVDAFIAVLTGTAAGEPRRADVVAAA
jgi:HD-GYP domain-containing protein (c-di-GMP phosphodiesterase class II)